MNRRINLTGLIKLIGDLADVPLEDDALHGGSEEESKDDWNAQR